MGRRVKWIVFALLVCAPLAGLAVLSLAFSAEPTVTGSSALTPDLVSRAEQLLRQHNPRRARGEQVRVAEIDGSDVNLMASYAARRLGMAATVEIGEGHARVRASVPARSPFGNYLNVTATVPESTGIPHLTAVTAGSVPVPDTVANWALRAAVRRWYHPDGEQLAADMIRSVTMRDGQLRLEYQWRADAADRMRALAVPSADAERLRAYHERIVALVQSLPAGRLSLVELLAPLLQLAQERSRAGGDPVVENRAALIAVTFYANGLDMAALVADAERWPRARRRTLVLSGRNDLAKHFLVSAALTATAGTPLSDVVGLSKELDDSRGGSGFSFSDLAADRAGTTFGAMAVGSGQRLQERAAQGMSETDVMPAIDGLVDNLPEAEFLQRFGGVGSAEYTRVLAEIDARIARCPMYRPEPPLR